MVRALKGWKEYEEAVKDKDLARALKFLKSIDLETQTQFTTGSSLQFDLPLMERNRDWEVLDTCLNANDMRLVSSAYAFLKDRGFLPNFGKCRNLGNFLFFFSSFCKFEYLVIVSFVGVWLFATILIILIYF